MNVYIIRVYQTRRLTWKKVHVFEAAGLGKAPFTWVGYHEERGGKVTEIDGVTVTVGAPGQPLGTCAFCGTGIAICCEIVSSDGKSFVVGSDCVLKTGDKGLKVQVDEMKRVANIKKQLAQVEAGRVWIDENREILASIPHPNKRGSWLDTVEWFYKNAGRSGKLRIVKAAKIAVANHTGSAMP